VHTLVVIIDDDPISILVCETLIKKNNFAKDVKSFSGAAEGLDFVSDNLKKYNKLPDVIFLDVQMPEIDGWGFLDEYEKIEEVEAKAPHVIMLSATSDPENEQKATERPAVLKSLAKPINGEVLNNLEI
jgi:CheY-like chemotaxis protein